MRAGNYLYNGVETPINSIIFKIKSGQTCRLVGHHQENYKWFATIYIYDTNEYKTIDYGKIEKYIFEHAQTK